MKNPVNPLILLILAQTMAFAQPIWNGKADTKWHKMFAKEFTITTPEQLAGLAKLVNEGKGFKDKTVKLGANIMLNDTAKWRSWAGSPPANKWIPIGASNKNLFNGTLDGSGYAVSGIYINSESSDQGLLRYLGKQGAVKNLGVKASYIKGKCNAGGIAGINAGVIAGSYSLAFVAGKEENDQRSELCGVGGIAGRNHGIIDCSHSAGTVAGKENAGGIAGKNYGIAGNSYFTGTVTGEYFVGGLAGINYGHLANSYSTGTVSGKSDVGGLAGGNLGNVSNSYFAGKFASAGGGGLVGIDIEGNVSASYYDVEASGRTYSGGGAGKTTAEMQSKAFADSLNLSASFLSMNAWTYEAGKYPVLSSNPAKTDMGVFFAGGNGTEKNPYIIKTRKHLEDFSMLVNMGSHFSGKHFRLGASIALNDTTGWQDWASSPPANVWDPIGVSLEAYIDKPFAGSFDGGGFVISGVYVNSETENAQGLFGYVGSGGAVKNLGVVASYIKGKKCIGGLAGNNKGGAISHSYFSGMVDGIDCAGGLVGFNNRNGTINGSYSTGIVKSKGITGGLVGDNYSEAMISDSYSASTVETDHLAGGLVGTNIGSTINSSYSTGAVSGEILVGGLIGSNRNEDTKPYTPGIISNSYSTGTVTGKEYAGGFAGSNGGKISNSYSSGAVKAIEGIREGRSCGGFVANNNGTISNSYSVGAVTGNGFVGSFVGNMMNMRSRNGKKESMVINSYYDKETNGQSDGVGVYDSGLYNNKGKAKVEIYGKTAKEMKQKATFKGWDFDNVWGISGDVNGGYPYLLNYNKSLP
jgi:hypothetical protein